MRADRPVCRLRNVALRQVQRVGYLEHFRQAEGVPDDPYLDERPRRELMEAGSDIAGSAAGAAVGLLFAGPGGALVGAQQARQLGTCLSKLRVKSAGECLVRGSVLERARRLCLRPAPAICYWRGRQHPRRWVL